LRILEDLARYFHRPPDRLGPEQIREYTAHLFRDRKLSDNTVNLGRGRNTLPEKADSPRAALLPMCFTLLGQSDDSQTVTDSTPKDAPRPLWLCPQCGGTMAIVERFTASEARLRA